jgi:hypothetical protein
MKTLILNHNASRNCEGVSRRDVLRVGAVSFFGLSLPQFLAMRAAAAAPAAPKAEAVILMWCGGGPSHIDSFDPQPDAPSEIRGEFQAIPTNVAGIRLSEHLPNTAKVADKIAIVRSLTSNIAAHEQASQYLMTGYKPLPTLQYPSYGSIVAKELGVRNSMPPYIGIPNPGRGAGSGFIGASYNPFYTPDPGAANYRVQDVQLPAGVDAARLARRRGFTQEINGEFVQDLPDDGVRSVDSFYERAYDLVTSQKARKAFDLDAEPAELRERYGPGTYGQGALLARRLVEAGRPVRNGRERRLGHAPGQLQPPLRHAASGPGPRLRHARFGPRRSRDAAEDARGSHGRVRPHAPHQPPRRAGSLRALPLRHLRGRRRPGRPGHREERLRADPVRTPGLRRGSRLQHLQRPGHRSGQADRHPHRTPDPPRQRQTHRRALGIASSVALSLLRAKTRH